VDSRLLPLGEHALLVELGGTDEVLTATAALGRLAAAGHGVWRGVEDLLPAARTVLITLRPGTQLSRLRSQVQALLSDLAVSADRGQSRQVEIEVVYDGPDLADVARHTGLTAQEVIEAHTGTPWRVGFTGFAPGFGYLVGGDPRLRVPRLATPRKSVPAGSVALAGDYSGIYPRSSPGGWQLIGRTSAVLWDLAQDPPALLTPGTIVTFRAVPS
jgi:KipI family sensor histidine kinase inhibitor